MKVQHASGCFIDGTIVSFNIPVMLGVYDVLVFRRMPSLSRSKSKSVLQNSLPRFVQRVLTEFLVIRSIERKTLRKNRIASPFALRKATNLKEVQSPLIKT